MLTLRALSALISQIDDRHQLSHLNMRMENLWVFCYISWGFTFTYCCIETKKENHVSFNKNEFWTKYKTTDYRFEVCYASGNASFQRQFFFQQNRSFERKKKLMVKLEAIKFEAYKWPQREPCFSPVMGFAFSWSSIVQRTAENFQSERLCT